jgi:hypothetical protein
MSCLTTQLENYREQAGVKPTRRQEGDFRWEDLDIRDGHLLQPATSPLDHRLSCEIQATGPVSFHRAGRYLPLQKFSLHTNVHSRQK